MWSFFIFLYYLPGIFTRIESWQFECVGKYLPKFDMDFAHLKCLIEFKIVSLNLDTVCWVGLSQAVRQCHWVSFRNNELNLRDDYLHSGQCIINMTSFWCLVFATPIVWDIEYVDVLIPLTLSGRARCISERERCHPFVVHRPWSIRWFIFEIVWGIDSIYLLKDSCR